MKAKADQKESVKAKRRRDRGFTLTELLIVVAIIAILAFIAIPLFGSSKEQLKNTELDSIARQIFVAAQNKSSTMLALGTFESFDVQQGQAASLYEGFTGRAEDYRYAKHSYLSDSSDHRQSQSRWSFF